MLEQIKNLEILEKPEVTFKRQLMKNPFYPFEKTDENRKLMWCLDKIVKIIVVDPVTTENVGEKNFVYMYLYQFKAFLLRGPGCWIFLLP